MSSRVISNIVVNGARLASKNFSGRPGKYNDEGVRSFSLVFDDPEMIEKLVNDGWNINVTEPNPETGQILGYLRVAVRFDKYPPRIFIIENGYKTPLNEDNVGLLDSAEIENIDLTVSPRVWDENHGRPKIKAYLRSMFVTLKMDELDKKYFDLPIRVSE